MPRFSFASVRVLLALGLLAPAVPSCKDNPPTAIVLAISSEASIPREIDSISLEVGRGSTTTFARSYAVDPATGQAHIPGSLTFSLHPDESLSDPIRIMMKANQKGEQVSLRSATMSFIEGKSKLLRMELRFSCLDFPKACAADETCLGGKCQRDLVDSSKLPDAPDEATKIFPTTAEGGCFDARDEKCAAGLNDIPDRAAFLKAGCVLDVGSVTGFDRAHLNVFALWKTQADQGHSQVLDNDPLEGWTFPSDSSSAFQLTDGLCQQVASGQISRIAFNFNPSCEIKSLALPVCLPDPADSPVTSIEQSACHHCAYVQNKLHDCGPAFQAAKKDPTSGAQFAAAFACPYDGKYSSQGECDAVRGCFLTNLSPLIDCAAPPCNSPAQLWAACVADFMGKPSEQCAEFCGKDKDNLTICKGSGF